MKGKIHSLIPTEVKLIEGKVDLLFVTYNGSGYSYPDLKKRFREMTLNDFNILWNGKTTKGEVVSQIKFRDILLEGIRIGKKNGFDFHNLSLLQQIVFMEEVWRLYFAEKEYGKAPLVVKRLFPEIKVWEDIQMLDGKVWVSPELWRLQ